MVFLVSIQSVHVLVHTVQYEQPQADKYFTCHAKTGAECLSFDEKQSHEVN
jgi:hypothetical protein